MLRNKLRFCDTCDAEIPGGQPFRKLTLSPDAAAKIVLSRGVGTCTSVTHNDDGTLAMDVCIACAMNVPAFAQLASNYIH
ncbi:MAG: hypothetical protein ABR874_00735 [Candidatus Sulfotelmatobacter sp.]|jgi:hypothetical protein